MKRSPFSIFFVVLFSIHLTSGWALAGVPAPALTVTTSGTTVSLSWNSVDSATGYKLFYAPSPYTGPDSISSIDMGSQVGISAGLWEGAAFYVAVQAYNDFESSEYSNIGYFIIDTSTYTNSLGQTFVLLPAGTFTMGSPLNEPGKDSLDENPQHQVTLTHSFYMQQTEVTQAQWEAVMGSNPSYFTGCPSCPVEQVSWNDVQAYINQMNLRGEGTYSLATEAQWEYATRAGSTTAFYNGGITSYPDMYECNYDGNLTAIGWYCDNSESQTQPVALKTPNAWGLYDMSGNVNEWVQDWYDGSYYDSSPATDPPGPSSGSFRVARGGNWFSEARECRSAYRGLYDPDFSDLTLGFRLTRNP